MAKSKDKKKMITALSLQGGGARGAYEYGAFVDVSRRSTSISRPTAPSGNMKGTRS